MLILSLVKPWRCIEGVFLPVSFNTGFDTNRWILNGQYECGEIAIIKEKIEKKDVVFEIGTGMGFISSYCAKVAGDKNVYTYEANTNSVRIIKAVFKKNKVSPQFTNAYLAQEKGTRSFPVNRKNLLGSSAFIENAETVSIPQLDLNEEIKRLSPSFLIMDIEGGEFDIFSIIAFQTIHKIQFELHPAILGEIKCNKIFSILQSNGFKKDHVISSGVNYFFYR